MVLLREHLLHLFVVVVASVVVCCSGGGEGDGDTW